MHKFYRPSLLYRYGCIFVSIAWFARYINLSSPLGIVIPIFVMAAVLYFATLYAHRHLSYEIKVSNDSIILRHKDKKATYPLDKCYLMRGECLLCDHVYIPLVIYAKSLRDSIKNLHLKKVDSLKGDIQIIVDIGISHPIFCVMAFLLGQLVVELHCK